MQNPPSQSQAAKPHGYRIDILIAAAGMVLTFILGIFVGIHPNWIPVGSGGRDFSQPTIQSQPDSRTSRDLPTSTPTTAASPAAN
jgi:hypothetical protein